MRQVSRRSPRSTRLVAVALMAVAGLTTSGCFWTSHGYGWDTTRSQPLESTVGPTNVAGLEERWRFDGVAGVTGTPTVMGDTVYFGAWDGVLRAVAFADGQLRWATPLVAGAIDGTVTIVGDVALAGDSEGRLHAVDRTTGAVRWTTLLDAHADTRIYSSPTVVDGLVVIGVASTELAIPKSDYTFRGSVVGLDLATGAIRWRTYVTDGIASGAGGSVWSSAAYDPARRLFFIGTGQSYEAPASPMTDSLLALRPDGSIAWHRQFTAGDVFTFWNMAGPDADIGAAPNLFTADGRDLVGVGDKAGHYAVFDRATGETVWTVELPQGNRLGGIMATSAYADGVVYVSSNRWGSAILDFHHPAHASTTWALDAATGDVLWSRDLPSPVFGGLSHANGVIYQPTVQGSAYALDAATGTILWSDALGADMGGGLSISAGTVFAPYGFWFISQPANPAGGLVAYRLP